MLIGDNSPLRRLPANLNPKQTQFCDGLRFTVEMADIAYQQLTAHLIPLSGGQSGDIRVSAASPAVEPRRGKCSWRKLLALVCHNPA